MVQTTSLIYYLGLLQSRVYWINMHLTSHRFCSFPHYLPSILIMKKTWFQCQVCLLLGLTCVSLQIDVPYSGRTVHASKVVIMWGPPRWGRPTSVIDAVLFAIRNVIRFSSGEGLTHGGWWAEDLSIGEMDVTTCLVLCHFLWTWTEFFIP
jgi:hypothetical protein